MEEGCQRSAPRNAEDERHDCVVDLLFARVEAQRLVIREMKPTFISQRLIDYDYDFLNFVVKLSR